MYSEYNTKKSKMIHCYKTDTRHHQLELCENFLKDGEKVDRILVYMRRAR